VTAPAPGWLGRRLQIAGQFGAHLGEHRQRLLQRRLPARQAWICTAGQPASCRVHQRHRIRSVVGALGQERQCGQGLGGRFAQRVDVLQPPDRCVQLGVLPGQRVDGVDLLQPHSQQLFSLGEFTGPVDPVGELPGGVLPPLPQPAVVGNALGQAGEPVEHRSLRGWLQQRDGFRLSVHGQQRLGELGQHGERRRPASDMSS